MIRLRHLSLVLVALPVACAKPSKPPPPPLDAGVPHLLSWPSIMRHGGTVMTNARVVALATPGDPIGPQFEAWGQQALTNPWWSSWAPQYGLEDGGQGFGFDGPPTDAGVWTYADLQRYVSNWLDGGGTVPPNNGTLYEILLPPNAVMSLSGGLNTNCNLAGGEHISYDSTGDTLAWIQQCVTANVDGGLSILGWATMAASHELAEAATDPYPPGGYNFDTNTAPWTTYGSEVGDLCEGSMIQVGGWEYQRIWSPVAAKAGGDPCVPAVSDPYYTVTAGGDWFNAAPGQTVSIPLTGFATLTSQDWALNPHPITQKVSSETFNASIDSGTMIAAYGSSYASINDGRTAALQVTIPSTSVSGDWVIFNVHSFQPAYAQDGTHDFFHSCWIGINVY